ncbi:BluE protein (plasmid) [Acidiphilium multivorum AIU301]|uniref:BluE protein n=1 Tax=Acidiphilium multivorum (strain DSM 11245 / JCM 8867 / NBRC 100883 / AIU 301) TaxID=926570 RepID=F0J700_ACIMA|nr:BluE protein [Acidiphilium multivorum AIU301]
MNGIEIAVLGHFGEFLQGRIGPGGPVALVTVPCAFPGPSHCTSRARGC